MKRDSVMQEMQMLTGVVSEDFEYLLYLMLKDGTHFKQPEVKELQADIVSPELKIASDLGDLDAWFDSFKEIV